jgi:hypothetical protein
LFTAIVDVFKKQMDGVDGYKPSIAAATVDDTSIEYNNSVNFLFKSMSYVKSCVEIGYFLCILFTNC